MKRRIMAALTATLFSFSVHAAETNVVEAFVCNLNPGKTMADLSAATENYVSQRGRIDSPTLQKLVSRVWVPNIGSAEMDFVWFNTNMTFREWGEMRNAYMASSVGASIQAQFDEVSTCERSGIYAQEMLFTNLDEQSFEEGPVSIESYVCLLHEGKTIADSDAAVEAWKPAFAIAVEQTGATTFVGRRTPIISSSGFDLAYFAVWDSTVEFADTNQTFDANPASATSDGLFAAAHRCDSTLFTSTTMVPPPD